MRIHLLVVMFAPLLLVLACTTDQDVSDETSGSTASEVQRKPRKTSNGGSTDGGSCTFMGVASGSSTDGTTSFADSRIDFACPSGQQSITCQCGPTGDGGTVSTCGCNGVTFPISSTGGCMPSRDQYAKCNLPAPPG